MGGNKCEEYTEQRAHTIIMDSDKVFGVAVTSCRALLPPTSIPILLVVHKISVHCHNNIE